MILPFIFVRYAPGACGTFLLTVLSAAPQVACWDPAIEAIKGQPDFDRYFLDWFCNKFTSDLHNHLKHEPHHPYKIDFFSAKHPRGNEINSDEFIDHLAARNDTLLLDNINQNKKTALRLNKSTVPNFGLNNPVVNIFIDNRSKKWLNRTRWIKLFGHYRDAFILKEEHPEFLKAKGYNLNFNNQYQVQDSWINFCRKYVISDPVVQMLSNKDLVVTDPSNTQCTQHWINLGDLLNPDRAVIHISQLAQNLSLDISVDLLSKCYAHYYKTNIEPILSKDIYADISSTRF
jgi:hypothetical protein